MKVIGLLLLLPALIFGSINKNRIINYQGDNYNTTFDVPAKFLGRYTGDKSGYLLLNSDGTGEYKYDIFGYAPPSCKKQTISVEWGFVLDDQGEITRKKRDYGYSYPILLKSTGPTSFQGCRSPVLMDYILVKPDGIHVSSSDDWMK